MRSFKIFTLIAFFGMIIGASVASAQGFKLENKPDKKQVDVLYNGKLLTSYCYYDSVMKPVLYPVNTISGIEATRGYPLHPKPGERVDHPHHIGVWLNYEHVNGLDFWNNSTAIPYERRSRYGTIYHQEILKTNATKKNATLEVRMAWKRPDQVEIIKENTQFVFTVSRKQFIIDRITTLQALQEDVHFKDVKDGFLGIRVARELELPSNDAVKLVDVNGAISQEAIVSNNQVTGSYVSSEGLHDNAVWGTRARWVSLSGTKNNKPLSITIFDHPSNVGYPSYWHARGYGLFAINPFGQEVFSNGKEKLDFTLKKGEKITFRYRIVIQEDQRITPADINAIASDFSKKR